MRKRLYPSNLTSLFLVAIGKTPDPYYDLILDDDITKNQWPLKIDEYKKSEKQSLMAECMTKEIFDELKNHKTKNGWTIARAINTGVTNAASFMGCHAGDLESYSVFGLLFKGRHT